jgi:predicted peroxiredoxin
MPILKNTITGEDVTIYIEVDESQVASKSPYGDMRGDSKIKKGQSFAREALDAGVELVRTCATKFVDGVKDLNEATRPDKMEVEFAINFHGELGAILAKSSADAQLKVTMTWGNDTPTNITVTNPPK